tara:strand:+ start:1235 stop:1804 length:570 start_codon:yes stop_codon:yes gene_type:complete
MILKKKILLTIYLILVFFLLIITLKDHYEQDYVEHFNESMMLRSLKRKKNSECKTKCLVKYKTPDEISACKLYCKCKKKCNNNKKCIKKKCIDIKRNIYRNNKNKIKKIEIKDKLKNFVKREKKENKKLKKKKEMENLTINNENENKQISYVDTLIDKYFTDNDKQKLFSTHNHVKHFYKDIRKVLRIK